MGNVCTAAKGADVRLLHLIGWVPMRDRGKVVAKSMPGQEIRPGSLHMPDTESGLASVSSSET